MPTEGVNRRGSLRATNTRWLVSMLIMSEEAKSDRPQVVDIGWRCMKVSTALQACAKRRSAPNLYPAWLIKLRSPIELAHPLLPLVQPPLEREHLCRILHQPIEHCRSRLDGKGVVAIDVLAKLGGCLSPLHTSIVTSDPPCLPA
jgi:hypothetical protein